MYQKLIPALFLLALAAAPLRADWTDPNERDHALSHMGATSLVAVAVHAWDSPAHLASPWTCRLLEFGVGVLANSVYLFSTPHSSDEITERSLAGAAGAALPQLYAMEW
jgi:hypothetical protein